MNLHDPDLPGCLFAVVRRAGLVNFFMLNAVEYACMHTHTYIYVMGWIY
mgnify:CR=1 FL=1